MYYNLVLTYLQVIPTSKIKQKKRTHQIRQRVSSFHWLCSETSGHSLMTTALIGSHHWFIIAESCDCYISPTTLITVPTARLELIDSFSAATTQAESRLISDPVTWSMKWWRKSPVHCQLYKKLRTRNDMASSDADISLKINNTRNAKSNPSFQTKINN